MYTTYHFNSVSEVNSDFLKAIKAAFKGKRVVITIEEEQDETAFLKADPVNIDLMLKSIAQDKNGAFISVTIPDA